MAKVVGIGGVFLKFQDPEKMRQWYRDILRIKTNDYGVLFGFNGGETTKKGYLQLGTFESTSDYFGKESQQCMLNFRVDNMIEFQKHLIENKVAIVNEIQEYSYGKFLHIEDPEGNRVELWEALDREFDSEESVTMY